MVDANTLKAEIHAAFKDVAFPGDWNLQGSDEGDEPFLVTEEFAGKDEWQSLEASFLDQALSGYGSALSFFSDEAFHFCLPAYLIADVDELLECASPVFHLCHGLDDRSKNVLINPRRYGEKTWSEYAEDRFAMFTRTKASAVVSYLRFKWQADEFERASIESALRNFWSMKAGEAGTAPGAS
jgi:hypothetical protein